MYKMGVFGATAGSALGKEIGGDGVGGDILGALGGIAGSFLPFKEGGYVPYDTPAILHKNEFVLPAHVKPTKAQLKAVKAGKKKKKAKAPTRTSGAGPSGAGRLRHTKFV